MIKRIKKFFYDWITKKELEAKVPKYLAGK